MGEISSNGLLESHRQTDLCPGGLKPVCFLKPGKKKKKKREADDLFAYYTIEGFGLRIESE